MPSQKPAVQPAGNAIAGRIHFDAGTVHRVGKSQRSTIPPAWRCRFIPGILNGNAVSEINQSRDLDKGREFIRRRLVSGCQGPAAVKIDDAAWIGASHVYILPLCESIKLSQVAHG
jgi:hypothetical protein